MSDKGIWTKIMKIRNCYIRSKAIVIDRFKQIMCMPDSILHRANFDISNILHTNTIVSILSMIIC